MSSNTGLLAFPRIADEFITPVVIATGRQRWSQKQNKFVLQSHYSRGDHFTARTLGELWQKFTAHNQRLNDASATGRADLKTRLPFYFGGGLANGGMPITGSGYDIPYSDTKDPANDIYRRRNTSDLAPCALIVLDGDEVPVALVDKLTGVDGVPGVLADYCGFIHGTASGTPDKPRVRIGLILAEAVSVEDKPKACAQFERQIMQQVGAIPTELPGSYTFKDEPVQFDASVYREAQVCYMPEVGGYLEFLFHGKQPYVADLQPLTDEVAALYASAGKKRREPGEYSVPDNLTGDAAELADWFISIGGEPGNKPGLYTLADHPFKSDPTEQRDRDTSFALQIDGDATKSRFQSERATWQAHCATCVAEGRSSQYAAAVMLECPKDLAHRVWGGEFFNVANADDFEDLTLSGELVAETQVLLAVDGRATFLTSLVSSPRCPAFKEWNGFTGVRKLDDARQETADALGIELRNVPPRIRVTRDKKGNITDFKHYPHSDNFRWVLYKNRTVVSRNLLTWQVECFNPRTGKHLASGDVTTKALMLDYLNTAGHDEKHYKNYFDSLVEGNAYHPVCRMLHGKQWDGIERVQRVINCLPVAPGDVAQRDVLLKTFLVGAIAALDDGYVSLKFAPVLFSESNDWFKTAVWSRLFSICPGAFKEGVSIDPASKDSTRQALFAWASELGELDQMTRRESGPLKAFLPKSVDEWRSEHKDFYARKPRQTVFPASVNRQDFLQDPTLSSRFPVIPLTDAVDIEEVNRILGWRFESGKPELVEPESLIQFWLEVRDMRAAGASHVLDVGSLREMKRRNEVYVDHGSYHAAVLDKLAAWVADPAGTSNPFPGDNLAAGEWFNATDVARVIGVGVVNVRLVGRALTTLERDGALEKKRSNTRNLYSVVAAYFKQDDSDE